MSNDRREKPRTIVCFDAQWEGASSRSQARVIDLSETGCYVDAMNETLPGEVIQLKMQLPEGEWLELVGEVAHSATRVGFGLRFREIDEPQLAKLRLLLADLPKSREE